MSQRQRVGPVLAGICAAALAASLAACGSGVAPASTPPVRPARDVTVPPTAGPAIPTDTALARATRAGQASVRIKVPRRVLENPDAIAVAGGRVWVANSLYPRTGDSRGWVTELDAGTGALIRVISGYRYGLTDPEAIAADGRHVWVVNTNGDSVTELSAATGALIRIISGWRYQLSRPGAIALDGNTVWLANGGSNSVTEIDAGTGALIRVISAPRYRLNTTVYAPAIAAAGNHVWVPNGTSNSVTEINATTGALIRVIAARRYQLNGPDEVAVRGDRLWVVNVDGSSVTEIDATTGVLIRVISPLPNVPFAITADGAGVWLVTNLGVKAVDGTVPEGSVAELSATTGALIRNISRPPLRGGTPGGAIAAEGAHVWVSNVSFFSRRGWVAEFGATTGALIRVISG